jgi:hypothetical protein
MCRDNFFDKMGCPALGIWVDFFISDFYFLEFVLKKFFFGVLHQAVRAVSKNRPKYPMQC